MQVMPVMRLVITCPIMNETFLYPFPGVISVARSFESFVVEPKSLDGNEDDDDDDSNLYAEIQADEAEQRQDSRMGKDYDCLDFYRNEKLVQT